MDDGAPKFKFKEGDRVRILHYNALPNVYRVRARVLLAIVPRYDLETLDATCYLGSFREDRLVKAVRQGHAPNRRRATGLCRG